ncbi:MAG TPA: hypothetical protein VJN89_13865 [Candidatus Acidoferrum sp.]|nr:hypothetical protein [Candidatus Acidoferrum sp.]
MKSACKEWKDQLLEAALTEALPAELELHLRNCKACAEDLQNLQATRARQDSLLPLLACGSQPSPDFRARVLAAAAEVEIAQKRTPRWRVWALAGAVAAAAIVFTVQRGIVRKDNAAELAVAQRLAEWRAPSDSLLKTPGQEILKTTPKLGESYLPVPATKVEEE